MHRCVVRYTSPRKYANISFEVSCIYKKVKMFIAEKPVLLAQLIMWLLLHRGVYTGAFCRPTVDCPSILHKNGARVSIIQGVANRGALQGAPKTSMIGTDKAFHIEECFSDATENACSWDSCVNGATCINGSLGLHNCECPPGYDGERCEFVVQLLIKNVDQTRVMMAKVSDLRFKPFFRPDFFIIHDFAYDDDDDTLYWVAKGPSITARSYIRVFNGANMWSNKIKSGCSGVFNDLEVYSATKTLYWSSDSEICRAPFPLMLSGYWNGEPEIISTEEDFARFTIDQQRGYMYCIGLYSLFRVDTEAIVYTELLTFTQLNVVNGFTMDEIAQRLYWTHSKMSFINYYDIDSGSGTLAELPDMQPLNILFAGGWLVWRTWETNRVCVMRARQGAEVEYCSQSQADGATFDTMDAASKGMTLRKVTTL